MNIELYLALAIGCALSLLFTERYQLLPAGLIVPGYLALLVDRPLSLITVLIISLLSFAIVKYGFARMTILYGRRKFVAMLLTGMTLKLWMDAIWLFAGNETTISFSITFLTGVGIIVPGLIANTMERQGILLTLGITILLTIITWISLKVLLFFF